MWRQRFDATAGVGLEVFAAGKDFTVVLSECGQGLLPVFQDETSLLRREANFYQVTFPRSFSHNCCFILY